MTRRLLTRLRDDEGGFTLAELLVAIPIGLAVMAIALDLIASTAATQVKLADRGESIARGRVAMDLVTRQLRSTVCMTGLTPPRAIEAGDANSVTLYVDLGDGSLPPERHVITFDPIAATLTERDYLQTVAKPLTYSTTPSHTRLLADRVMAVAGVPVFRYYAFLAGGTVSTTPLTTPLVAADAARTVDTAVSFISREDRRPGATPKGTTFTDDVFSRAADPTAPGAPLPCV